MEKQKLICAECGKEIEYGEEVGLGDDTDDVVCSDECLNDYFSHDNRGE